MSNTAKLGRGYHPTGIASTNPTACTAGSTPTVGISGDPHHGNIGADRRHPHRGNIGAPPPLEISGGLRPHRGNIGSGLAGQKL